MDTKRSLTTLLFIGLAVLVSSGAYAQTYTSADGNMTVPSDVDFDFMLATMETFQNDLIADGVMITPRPWLTGDLDGNGLIDSHNLAMLTAILREENTTVGTGYTGVDLLELARVNSIKQDFINNWNRIRVDLVFTDKACDYCGMAGFGCDLYVIIRDELGGGDTTLANMIVALLAGLETIADYPTMVNGNDAGFINVFIDQLITAFLNSEGFGSKAGTFTGNMTFVENDYENWGSGSDDELGANLRPGRNYLGARQSGTAAGDVDPLIAPAHLNLNEWTSFPNREDWLVACHINPPLRITSHPTGGTFSSGQNWTGSASVIAGQGNRTFRWYVYDDLAQPIGAGANVLRQERLNVPYVYTATDTYAIYYLTRAADDHMYVFRAIDTYWMRTSSPCDVIVNDVALVVTISAGGTVASGGSWPWTATITGGTLKPVNAIFWFDNGPPLGTLGDGYVNKQQVAWSATTGWGAGYNTFTINPTATTDTGNWLIQYNDTGGFHNSTDSLLTVTGTAPPVITTQPVGGTYYAGQSHTFSILATTASPPLTYNWQKYVAGVWTNTGWGNVTTRTLNPLVVGDAGDYRCIVTDSLTQSTTSATATLVVNPPVSITTQPVGGYGYVGGNFTMTVAATGGNGTLHYQWRLGATNVGIDSPTLSLTGLTLAMAGNYTCIVTDSGTSSATSAIAALAVAAPISITTQPASGNYVAGGVAVNLTVVAAGGHGTLNYQWYKDAVLIGGATAATYTLAGPLVVGQTGVYYCRVTDDATPTAAALNSNNATINVYPLLALTTQPASSEHYAGASKTFSVVATGGTGTYTYQWQKLIAAVWTNVAGATAANYTIASLIVGDAGSFRCVVTSGTQSINSNTAVLGVYAALAITTQPVGASLYVGNALSMNVVASGGKAPLHYQWRRGATNVGADNATFSIASVVLADAGTYTVVVTDSLTGTVTSANAVVTVVNHVTITTQPVGGTGYVGGTFTFTVVAAGGKTPLTYQWMRGATNVGANSPTLTLNPLALADAGSYTVRITDTGTDNVVSAPAAVLTVVNPVTITTQPLGGAYYTGQSMTLTVAATGGVAPLTYQWQKGGVNIGGATAATYTIPSLVLGDAGTFRCIVSDAGTSTATSNNAVITVTTALAITVQPAAATNLAVGAALNLSVTATGGVAPIIYQWQKLIAAVWTNIGGATAATYNIPAVALTDAGDFRCVVDDSGTAVAINSNTAVVTVFGITTQPTGGSYISGVGASHTFTVAVSGGTGAGPTYQWYKDGVLIAGATNATYTRSALVVADSGVYYVRCTRGTVTVQSNNATLTVSSNPVIINTQPVGGNYYVGAALTLTVAASGGTAPLTYQWQLNAANIAGATAATYNDAALTLAEAGSYTCIVRDSTLPTPQTATSNAAVVNVYNNLSITTHPAGGNYYTGQSMTLTVVAAGGIPPLSYQWQKGGVNIGGATAASYNIPALVVGDAGTYRCIVTASGAPVQTQTSNNAVIVVAAPLAVSTQPTGGNYYVGASVTLTCAATGGIGTPNYQWRLGGANIGGATAASYNMPAITLVQAGNYDCVITDDNVPASTVTTNVAAVGVYSHLTIATQPVGGSYYTGQNVTLSVTTAGGRPAVTYQWQRGGVDIAGATGASYNMAAITLAQAGNYTVICRDALTDVVTSAIAAIVVSNHLTITTQPVGGSYYTGESHTFTVVVAGGKTPLTYQWRKDGVNVGPNSNTYTIPALVVGDAGSYTCTITDTGTDSVTTVAVTLTVAQTVVINTHPVGATLYTGAALNLSVVAAGGKPPLSYQWQKGGVNIAGATAATYSIASVVPGDTGAFRCIVSDSDTSTATSNVANVTVANHVTITTQPAGGNYYVGTNVTLTVVASGGIGALTYQWQRNGVDVAGATAASYNMPAITLAQAGTYTCIVRDTVTDVVTSNNAVVNVANPMSITTQPVGGIRYTTQTMTFTVAVAGGSGTVNYQWQKLIAAVWTNIAGATAATYTDSALVVADSGDYRCHVTDAIASIDSNAATLTVVLPLAATNPVSVDLIVGEALNLSTVASNGKPPYGYQWYKNAVAITGATNSTYTIGSVVVGDAGAYRCDVNDSDTGSVITAVATVRVLGIGTQPTGATVTQGNAFSVTCVGAGGTGTFTYQWQKNGVNIAGATASTYNDAFADLADAGAYRCIVTSGTRNITSSVATITVNAVPAPVFTTQPATPQNKYVGDTVTLTVAISGGLAPISYQWQRDIGAGFVNITGATAATYTSGALVIGDTGSYRCRVTDYNGSYNSNNAAVSVVAHLGSTNPANAALITGENLALSVTASGGRGAISYQWQKGGVNIPGATAAAYNIVGVAIADAGAFRCILTDSGVPADVVTTTAATVTVLGITTQPITQTIVQLNPFTVTVVAGGGTGAFTYQWQRNAVNIAGATAASYTDASALPADAGNYTCIVTSGTRSITSNIATITVTLVAPPTIAPQPITPQNKYVGDTMTLTIGVSGGAPPITQQWQRDLGAGFVNIAGATGLTYNSAALVLGDSGDYRCAVTDLNGTTYSTTSVLSVVAHLASTPVAGVTALITGEALSLSVTASGGRGLTTYQWQKGGVDIAGATGSVYAIPAVAVADAGAFRCVLRDTAPGTDIVTTAAVNVTVLGIATQPVGAAINQGSPFTLTCLGAGGTGAWTYQWQKDSVNIVGATASSYTDANAALADAGNYTCIVTSGTRNITSAIAVITVTMAGAPTFTLQPVTPQNIYAGGTVTLSAAVTGGLPPYSYQWQRDIGAGYVNIAGATAASWTSGALAVGDTGSYRLAVTDTNTTVYSNVSAVTVWPLISITLQPVSAQRYVGQALTLTITATGGRGTLYYQWLKDGAPMVNGGTVSGALTNTLNISSLVVGDAAAYTCRVTDGFTAPAVTSNAATIAVQPVLTASLGGAAVLDRYVGGSITITCTPVGGYAPYTYQWRRAGVNLAGQTAATLSNPSLALGNAGAYDCVVNDSLTGTVTTTAVQVNVYNHLSITTQPAGADLVEGDPLTLTVVAAGGAPTVEYQWQLDGVDVAGATAATLNVASVNHTANVGAYTCVVNDGLSDVVTSAAANVTVLWISTQPVGGGVVAGGNYTFTVVVSGGGAGAESYQWLKGGSPIAGATAASYAITGATSSDAGTYSVQISQVGSPNPLVSNSVVFNVGTNFPVIQTHPVAASLYVGEALTMSIVVQTGTGVVPLNYQWQRDVGAGYSDIAGATAATLNIASVLVGDAGNYRCQVTDSDVPTPGQAISNPAALTVSAHVAISADPVGGTFNEGNVIPVLTLAAGGGKGPLSYQWAKDGVDIPGATAATLDLGTAAVSESGSYTCSVTDAPAGTDALTSAAAVIVVNGPLGISTQPVGATVTEPAGHTFTVAAAGGVAPYTYQWQKDGVDIVGATADTLTIDPSAESDEGAYRVRVTDSGVGPLQQQVTSNAATLTVDQVIPLQITLQPVGATVDAGTAYSFTVAVSDGTPPYTYSWEVNTGAGYVPIAGSDNPVLALTNVQAADQGSYRCIITDSAATPESVTSNPAILQVNTVGPKVPAVGLFGLGLMAGVFALGGALVIRRKK